MKWIALILAALFVLLQYKLWFGEGNIGEVMTLRHQIAMQKRLNAELEDRNAALAAQVENLKTGTAAIDELARSRLGMIGKGDTFYQYVMPAGHSVP